MTIISGTCTRVLNPGVQQNRDNSTKISNNLNGVSNKVITNELPSALNANKNDLIKNIFESITKFTALPDNLITQGQYQEKSSHISGEANHTSNNIAQLRQELPSSLTFYNEKLNAALNDFSGDDSNTKSDVNVALNRYHGDPNKSESARKRFETFLILRKAVKDNIPINDSYSLEKLNKLTKSFATTIAKNGFDLDSVVAGSSKSGVGKLKKFQQTCTDLVNLSKLNNKVEFSFNKQLSEVISGHVTKYETGKLITGDVINNIFRPSLEQHQDMWVQTDKSNLEPIDAIESRIQHECLVLDLLKGNAKKEGDPLSPTAESPDPTEPSSAHPEKPLQAQPIINITYAPVNININNPTASPDVANKDVEVNLIREKKNSKPQGTSSQNDDVIDGRQKKKSTFTNTNPADIKNEDSEQYDVPDGHLVSADIINTAGQGEQTNSPTGGRPVSGMDASTGMDDGVDGGTGSFDGTVSTADNRTGGGRPLSGKDVSTGMDDGVDGVDGVDGGTGSFDSADSTADN
ncbi:hypothetical protein, partial [Erwinia tasmaniensis]|uniref:hypothetical protein n=1 Tax=Erwinia tasmaniensis TaxID=338565 RepID=UPI003A4D853C